MGLQCVTEDVHSEKAGNEGRRHKQQGHQGEDFHYLVLVEIDYTYHGVLQILETLEGEVGVVDEGGNVPEGDLKPLHKLAREYLALEHTGDDPLLVHYVLADEHHILLKLVYVDEELLVDVLAYVHLAAVLLDLLVHDLYHIRIEVHSLLYDVGEDYVAALVVLRKGDDAALEVHETAQRHFPDGGQHASAEYEGDGLHGIVVRSRDHEVGIGEDGIVGLRETGRALDLLRLGPGLELRAEEGFHRPLLLPFQVIHIDPEHIRSPEPLQNLQIGGVEHLGI